ncbi:MAG: hypothetical protein RL757_3333 [Bacteroidota bacterium]
MVIFITFFEALQVKKDFIQKIIGFKILLLTICLIASWGCVPPEYRIKNYTGTKVDLSDPQVQQIFNLRDRNSVDSLMTFFTNVNPTYRYLSAMAFGSVRDARAVDSLGGLLRDSFADVRMAAAFALGQIGDVRAESLLLKSFERLDKNNRYTRSNSAILEAIGKCGSRKSLENLAAIQSFSPSDTALLEGQALGLYRFSMRDSISANGTNCMMRFLQNNSYPNRVRLVAAHYFMRGKTVRLDTAATWLAARLAQNDADPNIRMALARALGKSNLNNFAVSALDSIFRKDTDWRVRANVINALTNFEYKYAESTIHSAINDRNTHVAIAAADFCTEKGNDLLGTFYANKSQDSSLSKAVQIRMAGAAVRWLVYQPRLRDSINQILLTRYKLANIASEKAAVLASLAFYGQNYTFLRDEIFKADQSPIIKTAAAQAIARVATNNAEGQRNFREGYWKVKQELKNVLFQCVRDGDIGIMTEAVKALRENGAFDKKNLRDSVGTLVAAMQRLKLPNDFETYDETAQTINWIVDSTFIQKKKMGVRGADWNQLKTMSQNPIAVVKTNKGTFKMRLMPELAPSSVISFVKLARAGFFNGKIIHRVVPNFVFQTGCPRGDGYGSLDFMLHSEIFNSNYDAEGIVGMASAGPNTECSQWFVTHSPTFHLDTNYTIFATIMDGMSIVNDLQIGDSIQVVLIE